MSDRPDAYMQSRPNLTQQHGLWAEGSTMAAFVAALDAVLALHRPSTDHPEGYKPYCIGCWEAGGMDGAPSHPCPTVSAITAHVEP